MEHHNNNGIYLMFGVSYTGFVVHSRGRQAIVNAPTWLAKLTWDTELAARRGLRTWPRGASWPAEVYPSHLHAADTDEVAEAAESDEEARAASRKLAETQESALAEQTHRQSSTDERSIPDRESRSAGSHATLLTARAIR